MEIYTSYFDNFDNIPKNYLCIGIARFIPEKFQKSDIKNYLYTPGNVLAPSKELLFKHKGEQITNDEYAETYYKEIRDNILKLGYYSFNDYFAKMISTFDKYNNEGFEAIVFLCYEKPNEFCHRHLLAALMNKIGYNVKEYESKHRTTIKYTEELF